MEGPFVRRSGTKELLLKNTTEKKKKTKHAVLAELQVTLDTTCPWPTKQESWYCRHLACSILLFFSTVMHPATLQNSSSLFGLLLCLPFPNHETAK